MVSRPRNQSALADWAPMVTHPPRQRLATRDVASTRVVFNAPPSGTVPRLLRDALPRGVGSLGARVSSARGDIRKSGIGQKPRSGLSNRSVAFLTCPPEMISTKERSERGAAKKGQVSASSRAPPCSALLRPFG